MWLCGFREKQLRPGLMEEANKILLKISPERRVGVELRCKGLDRDRHPRCFTCLCLCCVCGGLRLGHPRTIDERKVGRFMGELWKITKTYLDVQKIWKDEWKLGSNDREAKEIFCTRWEGVDQHRKIHLAPRAGLKFINVSLPMANEWIKEAETAVNAVSVAGVLVVDSGDLLE
mmetsp:Transcript_7785/g.21718  ORF Transcript_7785/g.21718 Transcript_7785/m.21718 type:complete len:174 (-) Transcript_7785:50-571(-)